MGSPAQMVAMETMLYKQAAEALQYLHSRLADELRQPVLGIICGSGLNGLADTVLHEPQISIPYSDIPHFPASTGREQAFDGIDQNGNPNLFQYPVMPAGFFSDCWSWRLGQSSSWLAGSSESTTPSSRFPQESAHGMPDAAIMKAIRSRRSHCPFDL